MFFTPPSLVPEQTTNPMKKKRWVLSRGILKGIVPKQKKVTHDKKERKLMGIP